MGPAQHIFGQLWKEYAKSDSRYLVSDSFVVSIETITVVSRDCLAVCKIDRSLNPFWRIASLGPSMLLCGILDQHQPLAQTPSSSHHMRSSSIRRHLVLCHEPLRLLRAWHIAQSARSAVFLGILFPDEFCLDYGPFL